MVVGNSMLPLYSEVKTKYIANLWNSFMISILYLSNKVYHIDKPAFKNTLWCMIIIITNTMLT